MMLCSLGLGQEGYQLESDKATRGLYRKNRMVPDWYAVLPLPGRLMPSDRHLEKP